MYFEDVDLGERLGKAGWRNRYVPSAEVVHTGGHATTANADVSARMLVEPTAVPTGTWPTTIRAGLGAGAVGAARRAAHPVPLWRCAGPVGEDAR